jgi:hypothetical protein
MRWRHQLCRQQLRHHQRYSLCQRHHLQVQLAVKSGRAAQVLPG